MGLTVRPLRPHELGPAWDQGLSRWQGASLFSRWVYLRRLGEIEVLGVFDGHEAAAAFAVPVVRTDGAAAIARETYVSPYFQPLFRHDDGPSVRVERRRRAALEVLIGHIQQRFSSLVLPLHPALTDMTPFQQAHMQLELRTTYELSLDSLDALWAGLDPSIRNHIRKAGDVSIEEDPALARFDFEAAAFYEDRAGQAQWRSLAHDLVAQGRATALVAGCGGRDLGGLFLAHDEHTAYNLLSYFDRTAPVRGVPSALIWAAARAAQMRGVNWLDLEGSVLPNIETFYQGFGGARRAYFQVHWHADERQQRPILYRYDEKDEDAAGAPEEAAAWA